ncbi:LSU ribosomal protein L4p [Halalkalibacter akibai JCM 9157]|uniref:Large ribosomal subunit protein uL4 n=1 Tax=Halalkalibacter akibai (strain ATCC 43226 / DSM 21942 / CIP 109018 / JCM 9157 / 1139) TaxID=1236973 RepID=W4QTA2_HALA3|nr:LSU ribosomal protein L4p [Halalkalibacter akibai JCM 9157]
MAAVLSGLSIDRKALVVTADYNEAVALSARNLPGITFVTAEGVSVLDVLKHDKLVITKDAVQKVEEVLA